MQRLLHFQSNFSFSIRDISLPEAPFKESPQAMDVDQGQVDDSSSNSSDGDECSSDHSNNGDYELLDSSPFALTQSFLQDTQQYVLN